MNFYVPTHRLIIQAAILIEIGIEIEIEACADVTVRILPQQKQ